MATPSVTPVAGVTSAIAIGGTAVVAVNAGPNGGYIVNPFTAADQGLGATEPLYVDIVGTAQIGGFGTTVRLEAGQSFLLIPGQTTRTSVNAASTGHRFTVVSY